MKLYQYYHNTYMSKDSFIDTLGISNEKKHIVSLVGGGGKSSIIAQMGNELGALGIKTIITTSTHIYQPASCVVLEENSELIRMALDKNPVLTVGIPSENGKLKSVSSSFLEVLPDLCDVLLIEADGSKHHPIKAPAFHEPVIPGLTTLVLGVVGIDCLRQPISLVGHRPELLSSLLNKQTTDVLTPKDIAFVMESNQGLRKNVSCSYQAIINKVDTNDHLQDALEIASYLSSRECLFASTKESISKYKTDNK